MLAVTLEGQNELGFWASPLIHDYIMDNQSGKVLLQVHVHVWRLYSNAWYVFSPGLLEGA